MAKKNEQAAKPAQLSIEGEMTIGRAMELRDVMLPALDAPKIIEVDLSKVTEIDTAGLQLMVAAKLESRKQNKTLHFTGHSKAVVAILDMSGLGSFFGDFIVSHSESLNGITNALTLAAPSIYKKPDAQAKSFDR
jgi:anti-sigma B factor antagonist